MHARRSLPFLAVLAAASLAAAGCSSPDAKVDRAAVESTETTKRSTTTTVAPTTTTTVKATTTTKAVPAGLGPGSKGPEVKALQEALAAQRYSVGSIDGVYAGMTTHAVMAFQKAHGLSRTGRATPDVLDKIKTAGPPGPMMPGGGANRVEVDLKRQILQLYKGGELVTVLSVSTGNNKRFCVDGACDVAVTPGGSFRVTRKIHGIRVSRLGKLWNPVYFNGGIAIHGSPSVPAYPASHGCVRIPIPVSEWFHSQVPTGTPVYVIGGKRAAVPFNEPAPGEAPATTTTTAPPSAGSSTTTSTTAQSSTTTSAPSSTTSSTSTTTTTAPSSTSSSTP
jgi:peptidoglycan hydrolase-like protein with peptidoglycan-binding domain